MKEKKKIWKNPIFYLMLIMVLLCIIAGVMLMSMVRQKQYSRQLSLGEKYLKELDYENAEICFEKALNINEKKAKPYLYLADVYAEQGDYAQVAFILKKGKRLAGGEIFQERMELYNVEADDEDEEDEVQEDEDTVQDDTEEIVRHTLGLSYIGDKTYLLDIYPSFSGPRCTAFEETGYISFARKDFDNDGQEEILVITAETDGSADETSNYIYLVMLEKDGEGWGESAKEKAASTPMHWDDHHAVSYINSSILPYRVGFFCKETGGVQYLLIEYSGYASAFADGTEWELQQYSYQDDAFVKHETGLYMAGSDIQAELHLNPAEAYEASYADTIQTMRDTLAALELLPDNGVGYDNEIMGKTEGIEALARIEKTANVDVSELQHWDYETTIKEAAQIFFTDYMYNRE